MLLTYSFGSDKIYTVCDWKEIICQGSRNFRFGEHAGYTFGATLMNLCYDVAGSYVPALLTVGCIMVGVLILLQLVISSAHKEQKRVIEVMAEKK